MAFVLAGLYAYRAARPCGAGVGDPAGAVSGVLRAIERQDERALCQRVGAGYTIPTMQEQALRQRIEAAGGAGGLTVEDQEDQQLGAQHLLSVGTENGEVVAQFQTLVGERGAIVVAVTTSPGQW
ncbi:hypothetical protein GTQ99_21305 [Kineococcus sp. T13]|uniref:hypothetical protein n=1 Tax=Kineococcus vitellinus TaxID=2696565 RepID=UPI001412672E|nr:hypothetical protein [Kineococcus vitellinus]NAZ77925.1 hypothetical protein [Kineococcus vitellinus]